jgi:hypothetical protein
MLPGHILYCTALCRCCQDRIRLDFSGQGGSFNGFGNRQQVSATFYIVPLRSKVCQVFRNVFFVRFSIGSACDYSSTEWAVTSYSLALPTVVVKIKSSNNAVRIGRALFPRIGGSSPVQARFTILQARKRSQPIARLFSHIHLRPPWHTVKPRARTPAGRSRRLSCDEPRR